MPLTKFLLTTAAVVAAPFVAAVAHAAWTVREVPVRAGSLLAGVHAETVYADCVELRVPARKLRRNGGSGEAAAAAAVFDRYARAFFGQPLFGLEAALVRAAGGHVEALVNTQLQVGRPVPPNTLYLCFHPVERTPTAALLHTTLPFGHFQAYSFLELERLSSSGGGSSGSGASKEDGDEDVFVLRFGSGLPRTLGAADGAAIFLHKLYAKLLLDGAYLSMRLTK